MSDEPLGSDDRRPPDRVPVIGIGASAGGLEAVETILQRLHLDSSAIVVVQHLAPDRTSHLPEVFQRSTSSPVVTAEEGMRIEPNHVYVIPPGADLVVMGGVLHVAPAAAERPRLPVDTFFRSLSQDLGPLAIGVVLSGTGSDGALGLKAIRAEGGITLVQSPETAKFGGMPLMAIEAGEPDFCLAPAAIADEVSSILAHGVLYRPREPRITTQDRLTKIFAMIRDAFGHDMSQYKFGTVERRLERRMAVQKIERVDDYLAFLQSHPQELATLYHDLLIGVTSFFRDRAPFDALRTLVLPKLVEGRHPELPIRIWVPACSSGEEAYSLAMLFLEFMHERNLPYRVQIFATDIDPDSVQFGRRGMYPPSIALDVSAERLQRFFVLKQGGYQVTRHVRDMVVFATQNVAKDPPFSRIDLVSCRNLLIYLQSSLQKKVLRIFHYALGNEGYLLLGTSESVGDSPELFSLLDRKNKIYQKKNIPSTATFDVSFGESKQMVQARSPTSTTEIKPMSNIQQLADRRVLDRFGPPGVLISENFEVLQFRGKTGPYHEPMPGTASLNLLKLARPEIVAPIRTAVQQAKDAHTTSHVSGVSVTVNGSTSMIDIDVTPIGEPETTGTCYIVLFIRRESEMAPPAKPSQDSQRTDVDPRTQALERELASTKDYLQTTIEELETSNEELKSANEELQSANEELQSTNEELETSKEELQSTNEELTTVNDELHSRMIELSQSNDDLQNLLTVVDVPVVIVGLDQRIRRASVSAEKLLNLIPADVGRPVASLSWFVPAGLLERTIADVIQSLSPRSEEVTATNGRRYRLAIVPYKTADHAIKGSVLMFSEVNASPSPAAALSDRHD